MNEIQIFNNSEFGEIRTLMIEGEPYFVGKDVATVLGYAKPENAIATHVDEEDKTTTLIQGTGSNYKSKTIIINESGLYSLILSSKLPTAKKFKHWVTSEVLPAIRKTGSYNAPDYSALSPQLQFLIQMEQKQKELEKRQKELEAKLEFNKDEVIKATFEFGRIGTLQREEIQKAVKKRAIEICRYAETYDKIGKSVISSIYKGLQKEFDVPSYLDLKYNQYTDAMIFVQYFEPNPKLYRKVMDEMPKPNPTIMNAFFGGMKED